MARLLITGPGHSGGNWVNEIIRSTGIYTFTEVIEDRNVMYYPELPEGYATKITTDFPGVSWITLYSLLEKYSDMRLIFTFRHPVDNCLSKIVRGMPMEGNEPFTDLIDFSYEATLFGAVKSVECAVTAVQSLHTTNFRDRVSVVKLEDLIREEPVVVESLCKFVGIKYNEDYVNAYSRTRNKWQQLRYKGELDTSQIDMYKRWDTIYDGFYKDKEETVKIIARLAYPYVMALGYTYESV